MDRLVMDGQYFSEDAMREREPFLHHEYVGKFQDLSGRRMARPGERWFETLIRRSEEAVLVERIRGEQQRLGVAESDWVGNETERPNEEEQEEEEEEEEEDESETEIAVEKEKEEDVDGMDGSLPSGSSEIPKVIIFLHDLMICISWRITRVSNIQSNILLSQIKYVNVTWEALGCVCMHLKSGLFIIA